MAKRKRSNRIEGERTERHLKEDQEGRRHSTRHLRSDAHEKDFNGSSVVKCMNETCHMFRRLCPYPGLRSFTREDARFFYGREEQTDQVLKKLRRARFLAVVGPSGCGKSSLIRAGMMAALEGGLMDWAGGHWEMAEMRPGKQPFAALVEGLLSEKALRGRLLPASRSPAEKQETIGLLRATLRAGPLGLCEALKQSKLPERTNFLLLVDQFEEIFAARREGHVDETDAFVALLLATAAHRDLPLYVVITMRTDYLGDCPVFLGLVEAMNRSLFLTPQLDRDQRAAAILLPARLSEGDIEGELVNHLLNEACASPDQLPLLQHLLMRMWTLASKEANKAGERPTGPLLRFKHYDVAGRFERALSKHAGSAYEELDPRQQEIAKVLFRAICELGHDGRERRRLVAVQTIAELAIATVEEVVAVADVFRSQGRNFLMPPLERPLTPETNIDISHEALIRNWDKLKEWVNAEAKSAEIYLLLQRTAHRHEEGRAALWRTPDLEYALEWERKEKPSPKWAARYGGDFALAMQFLRQSEQRHKQEIATLQQQQQEREQYLRDLAEQQRLRAEEEKARADRERKWAEAERALREVERKAYQQAKDQSAELCQPCETKIEPGE